MRAAGPAPGNGSASALSRAGGSRSRGVRRARASFVDESLFGSPAGTRPAPPGFAPPWETAAAPGGGGPRPRSKCRLRTHTPSFCDESLFGTKRQGPAWASPWMRNEDVAKLHSLLWSPPPAPRNQPSPSPRSRETPLRGVHPPTRALLAAPGSTVGPKGETHTWKRPENDSLSKGWGAPGRGRSQSLSRLNTPSDGPRLASDSLTAARGKNQSPSDSLTAEKGKNQSTLDSLRAERGKNQSPLDSLTAERGKNQSPLDSLRAERGKNQSPSAAPAAPRGPLVRGRSKSVSRPPSSGSSMAVGGCKPRPPWK